MLISATHIMAISISFRQLKFAVYMTVCTHWAACGWFLVACSSFFISASDSHVCSVGSWAHHLGTTSEAASV